MGERIALATALIEKLEDLGLAEQGVVTPAQKMFAAMRLQGRSNITNEYEGNTAGTTGNAIPLFTTMVAGTSSIQNYRQVLDELTPGDTLSLSFTAGGPGTPLAVYVHDPKGRQLGHLPNDDATITASLLSAGKQLFARVANIDEKQHWAEVAITVLMQDG